MNKFKKIYKRIEVLEKRVAALEGQIQAQPRVITFVPEDSNGLCTNTDNCQCTK